MLARVTQASRFVLELGTWWYRLLSDRLYKPEIGSLVNLDTSRVQSQAVAAAGTSQQPPFIINPVADSVFLIFAPLIALALGIALANTHLATQQLVVFGTLDTATGIFIGTFIMAHLFIVFFRSHGNRQIFKLYPIRFTVVPLALFCAMLVSKWVLISVMVLATFWDVYHSSLQTFGIGRIYDLKLGNNVHKGRHLDIWLNHFFYIAPILAGATLMDHVNDFYEFEAVGSVFLTKIPARVASHQGILTWLMLGIGIPFILYYLYAYWRFAQQGYRVSFQKVALLASTGVCSIYTWGFNSFGMAFFIMNFFHAWQYFALVWKYEHHNIAQLFRVAQLPYGKWLALAGFVVVAFGYGFAAEVCDEQNTVLLSITLVVSIMHFWYDGFIWSVRKGQV